MVNADTGQVLKSIGNSSDNEEENLYLPYDVVLEVPTECNGDSKDAASSCNYDETKIDYPTLYVSDSKSRVQVYNAHNGKFLRTIGQGHGFEEGKLNNPLGESFKKLCHCLPCSFCFYTYHMHIYIYIYIYICIHV